MKCMECKYFHHVEFKGEQKSMGECRLNPPHIMMMHQSPISGAQQMSFMHPMVNFNHFCGQYSPKAGAGESGVVQSSVSG